MAVTTLRTAVVGASSAWVRVAFGMFAVGWGANQFAPMLIVYRHELGLTAGTVAGLFGIYAATLIPGLLVGGPASDRFGRRAVVLPFVMISPLATLLLVLGAHSLVVIAVGRALGGLCSGVVFGAATAWVQELSDGAGLSAGVSARRAAMALTAGFGLGPVVAAVLAQWSGSPLVVPYLPHLVIGAVAVGFLWPAPDTGGALESRGSRAPRGPWPPAAVRSRLFWLTVAVPAPMVFGAMSLAIVVLPAEVTSARSLSVGFAGVMTVLAFAGGVGVQPLARRLEAWRTHAANVAGLACAAAGAAVGVAAVTGADRVLAGAAAVLLGLAYGLCLVSGLRQAEQQAGQHDKGAVVACYYALSYVGFGMPYLVDALNGVLGRVGALTAVAGLAVVLAAWMGAGSSAAGVSSAVGEPAGRPRRASVR